MKKRRILSILLVLVMILVMMPVEIFAAAKAPAKVKAKAVSATYNSNKVSWKRISGASGYEVHRATSKAGKYKKVKTLTSVKKVTFTDKKLKTGTTYFYKVRAYSKVKGKKTYGKFSAVVKAKPVPAKVTVTATSATNKSNKVNWKKTSGASGYELYRAMSKSGKYTKIKTATSGKAGSFTDKNLTTGRTYYYKIRAYRNVKGKKVYGSYSKVVSAKPVQAQATVKPTPTTVAKPTPTTAAKPTATPLPLPTVTPIPEPKEKPEIGKVWMMGGANSFNMFLNTPDKLADWKMTQESIDIIGYADHEIMNRNSKADRIAGFAKLKDLGIGLGLEVGAIKEWAIAGGGVTEGPNAGGKLDIVGRKTFERQNELYWKHFVEEGAEIKAFTLDEPLSNVMNYSGPNYQAKDYYNPKCDYGFDTTTSEGWEKAFLYSVEQTAQFIEATRAAYPNAAIGAIEAMPSNFNADDLIRWNGLLETRLKAGSSGRGQDFFRLDADWNDNRQDNRGKLSFRGGDVTNSGWKEIKKIEDWCKSAGLPFSMIYWGPNVDSYRYAKDPETADKSWYDQVMFQGASYSAAGGSPDQYVIQTWVRIGANHEIDIPYNSIPETTANSFTNSLVDLYNTYIKPKTREVDIDHPGDISDWVNITFDVATSGWDSSSQLTMVVESADGAYREYDASKFVYNGQNSVVLQLDREDYKFGKLDLAEVSKISFNFKGAATCEVTNVSLITPRTAPLVETEEDEGEILPLYDGAAINQTLPRGADVGVYKSMFFNHLLKEELIGSDRANFDEWRYINFDIYVEDYYKLIDSGNQLRLKVGSPTDEAIAGAGTSLAYYNSRNAVYEFTNNVTRSGWGTVRIPVQGTIARDNELDFSQIKTLWFYTETKPGNIELPIPETTFAIKNVYLSGKTDPPVAITAPDEPTPEPGTGTLYLDKRNNIRYNIDFPEITRETYTYENWPSQDWYSGVPKPTDFSAYQYLEFYLYVDDLTLFEQEADADLVLRLTSGEEFEKFNVNVYEFKDQVIGEDAEEIAPNWYAIKIPMADGAWDDQVGGGCNLAAVTGMRFKLNEATANPVRMTLQYAYIRLTGGPEEEEETYELTRPADEDGMEYIFDGESGTKALPDEDNQSNILTYWPAGDHWPEDVARPVDFSKYESIEFLFRMEDKDLLNDNDIDLRLILVSGNDIDLNNGIYSFKNQVHGKPGLGSGWYAITIPLRGSVEENPALLQVGCDLTEITGMRLKVQIEPGVEINETVEYAYIRLIGGSEE